MKRVTNFEKRTPARILKEPSAWQGLESILDDLLNHYHVDRLVALEFGVEYGYSTIALSNFFDQVIGVDTFEGDMHSGHKEELARAQKNCAPYENIKLIQSSYQDFTKDNDEQYNLIHIDIVHTYEDTYACGKWAIEHAPVVIFHDTESFPEVKKAVHDLSGGLYDNYPHHHGLGIISR